MEALRFQLKYLPKLIYRGHDEIVFRDTGGRGGVKKRTPKIDERYPASSTCPRLHNNNDEECVFRIPSTARLAILHYMPRRQSERSPWNLCVEIGYWIYSIEFWSFVSLNIECWMVFPVCVETKDFFVLELSLRESRFFCCRIIVIFFLFFRGSSVKNLQ